MQMSRAQLLHHFVLAKLRLTQAKKIELRWRMLVALRLFPNPFIGANVDGEVTLTVRENYKLDQDMARINTTLDRIAHECPSDAISNLLSYTKTVKKEAYDALSPKAKQILSDVLTITPGLPTVKIKGQGDDDA